MVGVRKNLKRGNASFYLASQRTNVGVKRIFSCNGGSREVSGQVLCNWVDVLCEGWIFLFTGKDPLKPDTTHNPTHVHIYNIRTSSVHSIIISITNQHINICPVAGGLYMWPRSR